MSGDTLQYLHHFRSHSTSSGKTIRDFRARVETRVDENTILAMRRDSDYSEMIHRIREQHVQEIARLAHGSSFDHYLADWERVFVGDCYVIPPKDLHELIEAEVARRVSLRGRPGPMVMG